MQIVEIPVPENLLLLDDLSKAVQKADVGQAKKKCGYLEVAKALIDLVQCGGPNQKIIYESWDSLYVQLYEALKSQLLSYSHIFYIGLAGKEIMDAFEFNEKNRPREFPLEIGRFFENDTFKIDFLSRPSPIVELEGARILIIDDVLFSGETIKFSMDYLQIKECVVDFAFLCGIEETKAKIERAYDGKVYLGKEMPGIHLINSNILNVKDLINPKGHRLTKNTYQALMDHTNWMECWFGKRYGGAPETAEQICKQLQTKLIWLF
ncbi:MAG: phosphoribosyltransferase [Deltaproteobacteria bacterium]|nr:phosphoribosyltransferase [Deltaproteobacteria bacterium]